MLRFPSPLCFYTAQLAAWVLLLRALPLLVQIRRIVDVVAAGSSGEDFFGFSLLPYEMRRNCVLLFRDRKSVV